MLPEGTQIGRYRLKKCIGTGGMGYVYQAEDTEIKRTIAIKIIIQNPQARNILREVEAGGKFDHHHILSIHDFGKANLNGSDIIYIVMPLCKMSFADWLNQHYKGQPMPLKLIDHFLRQAASALLFAHTNNVIHRDVKPQNFLIREVNLINFSTDTPLPDLVLTDFGIAKFATATHQTVGFHQGTPPYMAPELWIPDEIPDKQLTMLDEYALAVMTYQLLTGRLPFQNGNLGIQHLKEPVKPPSTYNTNISKNIDEVILRALSKRAEDRYPSIEDFATAFHQAVGKEEKGEDIHILFNISESEALHGTKTLLTLPKNLNFSKDKKPISLEIPPNTSNGSQISLKGLGRPSQHGGQNGALVVTITTRPNTDKEQMISQQIQTLLDNLQNNPNSGEIDKRLRILSRQHSLVDKRLTNLRSLSRVTIGLFSALLAILITGSILVPIGYSNLENQISSLENHINLANGLSNLESGTPALDDPLLDNSGSNWDGGSCADTFQPTIGIFSTCTAQNTSFSNFIYQIHMVITQGDCGGISFRSTGDTFQYYLFQVCEDGSYALLLFPGNANDKVLTSGTNSAISTGLNQPNTIAVIADYQSFTLQVNNVEIGNASDATYSTGKIGVFDHTITSSTKVAYTDAKVWVL
jgi:eukaryotic-like serine/threonine-protein kinase